MIERDRNQQNMPNNSQVHTVLDFEIECITKKNIDTIIGWRTFREALSNKTPNEYVMSALQEEFNKFKKSRRKRIELESAVFVFTGEHSITELDRFPEVSFEKHAYTNKKNKDGSA